MILMNPSASGVVPLLSHTLEMMCDMVGADGGLIGLRRDNAIQPVAGFNVANHLLHQSLDATACPIRNFHDVFAFRRDQGLVTVGVPSLSLWQSNLALAIKYPSSTEYLVLILGRDSAKAFACDARLYTRVNLFRQIVREQFTLIRDFIAGLEAQRPVNDNPPHALAAANHVREDRAAFAGADAASEQAADPLADFLFDTLVRARAVGTRRDISYYSLRRWRSSFKTYQIAAIRALKRNPPDRFVTRVAEDIAEWVETTFGKGLFDTVTAVPCGHSGPGCFGERLAEAVAQRLGIDHVAAFKTLEVKGSSHPKTNLTRPKMQLQTKPKGHVLLIDDIVTSGSHITEAIHLLRESARSVVGVAWISDC